MTTEAVEEWRAVEGYEGMYEVSSRGRVRSLPREIKYKDSTPRRRTGRVMAQNPCDCYCRVQLSVGCVATTNLVHRLVASAFIGEIGDGMEVNHKDGNKQNNSVDNLEIVTRSANGRHAYDNGLNPRGSKRPGATLTEVSIPKIRKMLAAGQSRSSIAREFGVSRYRIRDVATGRCWSHA